MIAWPRVPGARPSLASPYATRPGAGDRSPGLRPLCRSDNPSAIRPIRRNEVRRPSSATRRPVHIRRWFPEGPTCPSRTPSRMRARPRRPHRGPSRRPSSRALEPSPQPRPDLMLPCRRPNQRRLCGPARAPSPPPPPRDRIPRCPQPLAVTRRARTLRSRERSPDIGRSRRWHPELPTHPERRAAVAIRPARTRSPPPARAPSLREPTPRCRLHHRQPRCTPPPLGNP